MSARRFPGGGGSTVLRAAAAYFGWVFAAGFALALVRVPFLVPRIGERWAELVEMPVMLAVIGFVAGRLLRRYPGLSVPAWLAAGALALTFLLLAEAALVLMQGQSLAGYLAGRDPLSGSAYLLSLLVFALMPAARFRLARRTGP